MHNLTLPSPNSRGEADSRSDHVVAMVELDMAIQCLPIPDKPRHLLLQINTAPYHITHRKQCPQAVVGVGRGTDGCDQDLLLPAEEVLGQSGCSFVVVADFVETDCISSGPELSPVETH